MRKNQTLTVAFLAVILAMPLVSLAQAAPRRAVARAVVADLRSAQAGQPYSLYNITVPTADGGHVEYLFIWQRSIQLNFKRFSGLFIVDTSPILHMAKYNDSGRLEEAITYVPLFLMQYNDTDSNGLFDLWTRNHREVSDEVEDGEIEWESLRDKAYRIYPLAPMFQMIHRQRQWEWTVSPLVNETIIVNNTEVQEFSWNVSATVPSIPWLHSEEVEDEEGFLYQAGVQWTSINVTLGYHVRLLAENPEVKYDLSFAETNWADAKNLRLALISTVTYRSAEPVVVKLGAKGFRALSQTVAAKEPIILVSEKAMEQARAFVSYTPEATVDGALEPDAVKTAMQPLFLLPTPVIVPEGLYAEGIITDIEGKTTRRYINFAHQVSVPRFQNSLTHDPSIGLVTQLATETLSSLPSDLISFRFLAVVATAATVGAAVYAIVSRRRPTSTKPY